MQHHGNELFSSVPSVCIGIILPAEMNCRYVMQQTAIMLCQKHDVAGDPIANHMGMTSNCEARDFGIVICESRMAEFPGQGMDPNRNG